MTLALSAARIKRGIGQPPRVHPRVGTERRRIYDILRSGGSVPYKSDGALTFLRDFYGMEIEGFNLDGRKRYRLIGEWDGPYFVPVERIVQDHVEGSQTPVPRDGEATKAKPGATEQQEILRRGRAL